MHVTPHRMDPALRAAFMACLDDYALPYEGDEMNFNDFTKHLSDAEYLANGEGSYQYCLQSNTVEMFPELLWLSLGR